MSDNLKAMIQRKELMREGSPEAEAKADAIFEEVTQNGGLTTEEVYALMAY